MQGCVCKSGEELKMDRLNAIFEPLDAQFGGATIKQDLTQAFDTVCESFGFEYYCLKTSLSLCDGERKLLKLTNYPKTWLTRYSESGYASVDPAAKHAIDHVSAASLESLMSESQQTVLKKQFVEDARDIGIFTGITMPLRSPYLSGFVNFNCREVPINGQFIDVAATFSTRLSEVLGRFCAGEDVGGGYHSLTLREKHVLFWGVNGKTAWETSMILGISQRTVIAHMVNSMAKLKCSNKFQMLSRIAALIDSDPALDEFRIEL
jgi:DNA-binding CsgD family transcriptional regulator